MTAIQRQTELRGLIDRARDAEALAALERVAGHEMDATTRAHLARRVQAMKAGR